MDFANALVEGRFNDAAALLDAALRAEYPAAHLERKLHAMYEGYADGPPESILFDENEGFWDDPQPGPGDLGWAYIGIVGDDFVEAVAVLVCEVNGVPLIRKINWGRP